MFAFLQKCCAIDREADELGLTRHAKKFIVLKRRGDTGQVLVHAPVPSPPMVTEMAYLQELDRRGLLKMKSMPSGHDSFSVTEAGREACPSPSHNAESA
ncbi:hypothetical protein [Nitrolancea hollandica]|nr:hypothetical protein [Nitrolancea hollandica]